MPAPRGEVLPDPVPGEHGPAGDHWVQVGLAPAPRRVGLLGELSALVRDWRADQVIEGFFFMHKPPGLRVRFAPAAGQAPFVRAELALLVRDWCADGLVARVEPGTYEPEAHRFGGHAAMAHVHRMFTVDAVTWLDHHRRPPRTPAWALSLAMLRPLFDAMDIDTRRECAVGARLAGVGRLVPPGVTEVAEVEDGLTRWWRRPGELLAALADDARAAAAAHAEQVAPHATAWAGALRGTDMSEAVAWYVIFHWNRAALTFGRQALLAGTFAGTFAGAFAGTSTGASTGASTVDERGRGDVR